MSDQPKEYTNEIPYDDLQFIISDLYGMIDEKKRQEKYEDCAVLNEIIESFERYACGDLEFEDVIGDLFTLCCHRYTVYGIRYYGPKRFVIFILPNMHFMYFYMEENSELNEMFDMADSIYESNKNMIDTCIERFVNEINNE